MGRSHTLECVLKDKKGYRNHFHFGPGVVDATDALHYEVRELRNLSALVFCKEHYGIDFDSEFIESKVRIPDTSRYVLNMVVKDHWWQRAPRDQARILHLISVGLEQLVAWANNHPEVRYIIMPYPGIGAGGLNKIRVRPLLEKHLDDRFVVCKPERTLKMCEKNGQELLSKAIEESRKRNERQALVQKAKEFIKGAH